LIVDKQMTKMLVIKGLSAYQDVNENAHAKNQSFYINQLY